MTRPAAPGVVLSTRLPITASVMWAIASVLTDSRSPGPQDPRVADEEREPPTRSEEPVEAFADLNVVARRRRRRVVEEQVSGEHARLQPVVDALTVHRVDEPSGVADRRPSPARGGARADIGSRHARGRSRFGPRSQSVCTCGGTPRAAC